MFSMRATAFLEESKMNNLCSGWTGLLYQKQEIMLSVREWCFTCSLSHVNCSLNVCYRRPDDWTLSAGGSGTIYGWGHNHRGQLGGIEGAKVKVPTPCEALAALRPVQLIGGEQTLFAVTADGKVRRCISCVIHWNWDSCGWRAFVWFTACITILC